MTANDIHGIEHGWAVKTADGHRIGSVEETTDTYIAVSAGMIGGEHRYLPAATLEHVRPELKEIEIDLTNEEVEQGDWSNPPVTPPRTEGAPLNEEAYADEADPRMIEQPRGPERDVIR